MSSFIIRIILYAERRNLLPGGLKKLILKYVNILDIRKANWISKESCNDDFPLVSKYDAKYPYVLGIIKEFWGMHSRYIAACRDIGVAYCVLDISGPNWHEVISKSDCHAYLVYPSIQFSTWKQMYDERLRFLEKSMRKIIFPSYDELWLWDSKRRVCYWLQVNDIPHPKTWIFYDHDEAIKFVKQTRLPIVFKSNRGAGSSGVVIFRDKKSLIKHVDRCFKKGYTNYQLGPNDGEWGFVLLQEYVPDAREWRVIRIGHSYFAYEKLRVGDFHSGSHNWSYSRPPELLLHFAKEITDRGRFSSMDLDIFVTSDGRYLVSELQTLFGMGHPYEMCVVDDKPGRMILNHKEKQWRFEPGSFCQNHLCNLRVMALLSIIEEKIAA
jgi:hypothetical protein